MGSTTFTVFFDDPFWVGVLEIHGPDGVHAARHVFGDEPSGPQLYDFALSRDYDRLGRRALAGPPKGCAGAAPRRVNPKRAARAAVKEQTTPVSTAAQRAIQASLEQSKTERRTRGRAQRDADADHRRAVVRQKAKARHRGH